MTGQSDINNYRMKSVIALFEAHSYNLQLCLCSMHSLRPYICPRVGQPFHDGWCSRRLSAD